MVKLANMLSRLNPAKILVVGDMLLDSYTMGKARRISPEAPVAIVNVQREEHRPGGAGNVILNLLSLGAEVVAIGRVGRDWAGQTLVDALKEEKVDTRLIVTQEGYFTPVKNRIIADNQQIVRIDHEQIVPLHESLEQYIIDHLPQLLEGVKVVPISDYGKGLLTSTLLAAIIQEANRLSIPIITDPKGHDFKKYKGTTIIKPNLSEAFAAAKLPPTAPLENAAAIVLEQCQAQMLMVTRSEAGISLFNDLGNRFDFPVHAKEVKDVTGAGDTVLAMLAHALANQLSYEEAAHLCNVAAGIAIEHVGCARVSLSDLALRLFEYNMSHKVFDQEHLFVLKEVLKRRAFNLLVLSQVDQLSPALFQSMKTMTQEKEALLVYIDDIEPRETFIDILSSLREVNFILLHLDSLKSLCQCAPPRRAYTFDALRGQLVPMEGTSFSQPLKLEVTGIVK
jgi:rfaE bifunctional protein kinase chain/domain